MSVLIVGSTALDSIKTPKAENPRLLGGSASHAAVAASFFSPVKFVAADTMDLWLNIALHDLLELIKRLDAFVLNDSEAHQLTKEDNVFAALKKIHKLGPKYVIIKKGSHGSILSGPRGFFICLAYPLHKVVDPTGAGDSFVGGMMGYLATANGSGEQNIRRAMIYGSVVASFCCEGFGLLRTARITRGQIDRRVKELERLTKF